MLYLLLAPVLTVALFKSIKQINSSIKGGNKGKLKGDVFFLGLILIITILLVIAIEWK
jgi:hypothetical protein